ncbi:MAG: helix-turn-helix domain-containing protein [Lachnospiraceae bacterium]|nr:helix-turn-helix domain-containing protein [Lachnospiraceae bacterium]
MSYTKFGEFVRRLRLSSHQVMGDMANLLGTSTSNLSAVENGRKNVPNNWVQIIVDSYHLNDEQTRALKEAIEESRPQLKLNLQRTGVIQRKTALQFARSFDQMDEETAQKIMKLLEGDD